MLRSICTTRDERLLKVHVELWSLGLEAGNAGLGLVLTGLDRSKLSMFCNPDLRDLTLVK
jgi:hypothetical protein